MSTVKRVTAPRLARPAQRYYKGRAPKGVKATESDSEADEDVGQEEEVQGDEEVPIKDEEFTAEMVTARDGGRTARGMNIALRKVEISDGRVIVDGRLESGRTKVEEEEETEEEEDEDDAAAQGSQVEESSEEETESEEEEAKPAVMFRPVFVPKRGRETVLEREAESANSEEAMLKREREEEERRKQTKALVAETIKRELAEKEATELIPDVDDTDGVDPAAEFEAWRLRELERIKRDKEEELEREREREELERRRAIPEEQRLREDLERAKKTREEKPKGQQKFLQKYWHKGAFHQEEDILKKHDFTEATESTIDVSLLPKVMQVKNFGKRSQTKYTHLLDQDTTAGNGGFGGAAFYKNGKSGPPPGASGSGCFICGGPHLRKDCPQLARGDSAASGANSGALGRPRGAAPPTGPRDDPHRDDDRGRGYEKSKRRTDDRAFRRSRSRSMSFSPPPRRRSPVPRRRSRSPDDDRYNSYDRERDKRRRVA